VKSSGVVICAILVLLCLSSYSLAGPAPVGARSSDDAKPQSPAAEQLIILEKALPEAQKKHDRDFYKRTLTDDFVSVGTDGKVHPREEILGDLASTQLSEYRPYNIQVVPLNEGAAVVTYDAIVRMAHYDDETPRYQHISSIWVKQGEQWRLKFQQATATASE
jgi:hypothetical protein